MAVSVPDLDSDASLVAAAQKGDAEAFAELFRRHYSGVRRSCARRLGDLRDGDEVAQAAFVRAWERIDRCQGDRRFGGWIQVIAHNLCIDTVRRRGRVATADSASDDAAGPIQLEPESALLQSERANLVRLALADLPPRQRDVVVARDLEDRRPGEIAAAFGLTIGAVDSLLLRGRRRLAAVVERLDAERGAVTTSSASSVVVAASSGRVSTIVQSLSDAVSRATYEIAAAVGMVPGVAGPIQKAAAGIVAAGAITMGTMSAGPASAPQRALVEVPDAPAQSVISLTPPPAPAAPRVEPRLSVAVPALNPPAAANPPEVSTDAAPEVLGEAVAVAQDGIVELLGDVRALLGR